MRQSSIFDQIMGHSGGVGQTFELRKQDGRVFSSVRAYVTGDGKSILIDDVKLPLERGDELRRTLPNGLVDLFIVQSPSFRAAITHLPAHFVVQVGRDNSDVPIEKTQPATINNTFHAPVGNVAQHSSHFSQTAGIEVKSEDLAKLVAELSAHLDELSLDTRQKQRAEAQLATLKAELMGDADPEIVRQAGRTLRNLTEGAVASLIATAVQPTVWHWIHQMLASFN
jgi:hypothetical protein